jgi:hypothetical protein
VSASQLAPPAYLLKSGTATWEMAMTRDEKRKKQAERADLIRFRRRLKLERDNWRVSDWSRLSSGRDYITGTAYSDLERKIDEVDYRLEKLDLELEPTPQMRRRKRRTPNRPTRSSVPSSPTELENALARKTPIATNIDRLRKDCGWSLDKLAEKTGIDKKLVLAHVHGKVKPHPSTVKLYADAFTKTLSRTITPSDLER